MTIAKKTTFTVTREILIKTITNYGKWSSEIQEYYKSKNNNISPATTKYGTEASMPRGIGGHSDPTYVQAVVKRTDSYIKRRIRAIREVDKRRSSVDGDFFLKDILEMWLQGLNNVQIAEVLGTSERTVRRYKDRIIDVMLNVI